MINIIKKNDKSIVIDRDGKQELQAATYRATATNKDNILVTLMYVPNNPIVQRPYTEIQVDGVSYPSAQETADALNQFIGNFKPGGGSPSPTPTGAVEVRYIPNVPIPGQANPLLIKTEYLDKGGSGTLPTPPAIAGMTFVRWTHTAEQLQNLQHSTDVGAIYVTSDGKTKIGIELTTVSGLTHSLRLQIIGTATLRISYSDGTSEETSAAAPTLSKTWAAAGRYEITIERISGDGTYAIGQASASLPVYSNMACVTYLYVGEHASSITSYGISGAYNMAALTLHPNLASIGSYGCYQAYSVPVLAMPNIPSLGTFCTGHMQGVRYVAVTPGTVIASSMFERFTNIDRLDLSLCTGYLSAPYCTKMTEFYLPDTYTGATASMIRSDESMVKFAVPDGVTTLDVYAVDACTRLKTLRIPSTVRTINGRAIQGNNLMVALIMDATTPPSLNSDNFSGMANPLWRIYVPDASVNLYKAASVWLTYANRIYPKSQMPTELDV